MILLTLIFNINKIREDKMKKSLAKSGLVVVALLALVCMVSISYAAEYHGLCSKCNHNWVSTSKPTKCPNCGNTGITYSKSTSENTVDKEKLVAVDNNIVLASNCIEKGLQCTLNGTSCCAPYSCKGKFPNTYCK
ncbi:MAG: hypothetical protein C0399_02945 [Syntrophus sp. (in: bacteria)]|nr:hypothetical protein [Syntrophus sp. (in: bacteria)]